MDTFTLIGTPRVVVVTVGDTTTALLVSPDDDDLPRHLDNPDAAVETLEADLRAEGYSVQKLELSTVVASPAPLGTCEWFALCTNDAFTTTPHPILGAVPICGRCATKMGIDI